LDDIPSRHRAAVTDRLKRQFVGRPEVIDLIVLAVVAGEHLFLLGSPGTAKSALIRAFASTVRGGHFEYLLTRFSEPNEVFGPIDLVQLREGTVATITAGMLPEAEFVLLDELFNANSAILNNLLTVLNERLYRRGREVIRLPLLSLFCASNHLPEDEALGALFDRFLLRRKVEDLPQAHMGDLLDAGWVLERNSDAGATDGATIAADDLRALACRVMEVDLSPIRELYADAAVKVRDLGIAISDRRAVKVLKLVAASTVLSGRPAANGTDLWVLRYVWDREEQVALPTSLVEEILRQQPADRAHPLVATPERVDGKQLARELMDAEARLTGKSSLAELARLREQVARVADRAAWVTDEASRRHLTEKAGIPLRRIGA
jgi:MoxR-like ATPase